MPAQNHSVPTGHSQVTSLSSAATVGTVPAATDYAVIQVQDQQVRWRDDGTAPTATVGMLMSPGDVLKYDGNLASLKFIEVAASAKLNVSFYSWS